MKQFMIVYFVTASALVLASCGVVQQTVGKIAGSSKACVDGVTYLQFPSGAVEKRTIDDKLVPC